MAKAAAGAPSAFSDDARSQREILDPLTHLPSVLSTYITVLQEHLLLSVSLSLEIATTSIMTPALDIPISSRPARAVSTSINNSPVASFHSPPSFGGVSSFPPQFGQQQPQQRELKPFNKEEFKILLLENVNQSGKDILTKQGYQVESLKTSLPEDELIEKIRWANFYSLSTE